MIRKFNFLLLGILLIGVCIPFIPQFLLLSPQVSKPTLSVQQISTRSALLSSFWKFDVPVQALAIIPSHQSPLPILYHIPGYGGNHREGLTMRKYFLSKAKENPHFKMIHVYLNPMFQNRYHHFVDSANNGPWARALVEEIIPQIEKNLEMPDAPRGRFITGHSSGGWTALALQLHYPDFFQGVWATSPDPIDFRDFYGVDLHHPVGENMYQWEDGRIRRIARHSSTSWRNYIHGQEREYGKNGGELASYEWTWSPRASNGEPRKLFDRSTGDINLSVAKAWWRYDLKKQLVTLMETRPDIAQKIHLFCGESDTFFLEGPTELFCQRLLQFNPNAECKIIPEKSHRDIYTPSEEYPEGLWPHILEEISNNH